MFNSGITECTSADAVVARAEHICPQKTGLLVAAEEGLRAEVCQTEAAALAWLDEASS